MKQGIFLFIFISISFCSIGQSIEQKQLDKSIQKHIDFINEQQSKELEISAKDLTKFLEDFEKENERLIKDIQKKEKKLQKSIRANSNINNPKIKEDDNKKD